MNRGFFLSLWMGFFNPDPVPQAVIDALTEVSVNQGGAQGGFQMKFTLGKNSPIGRNLLPSGFFDPRTRVIIAITIQGNTTVLMDGVITKQDVTPGAKPGESTLSVTGLDLTALMDFIDLTGIPYPALPVFAIVDLVLAKYLPLGVIPAVIPPIPEIVSIPVERIRRHQGTDYRYVNSLAQRYGSVFRLNPGPKPGMSIAYWGPESIPFTTDTHPALNVNMDFATNVESLNFSYDSLQAKQYLVTIVEPNSHIPIPIPLPDIAALRPTLAKNSAAPLKSEILDVSNASFLEAAGRIVGALLSTSEAITASGSVDVVRYGYILKPRNKVPVRGAGPNYDGLYHIKTVSHSIKRGEYKQSFTLARGGTGSSIDKVDA